MTHDVCDRCLSAPATHTTWFRLSAQRKDGTWSYASTKRCDDHPYVTQDGPEYPTFLEAAAALREATA